MGIKKGMHAGKTIPARIQASIPGLTIYVILWLLTVRYLDWRSQVEGSYGMHSLGRNLLEEQPWESLQSLHIQPPGLNAVQALDLFFTPDSHMFLLLLMGVLGLASVFFCFRCTFQCESSTDGN